MCTYQGCFLDGIRYSIPSLCGMFVYKDVTSMNARILLGVMVLTLSV